MKKIPGLERYSATKDGNIWDHITKEWVRQGNSNGYKIIRIKIEGKTVTKLVHRLVCLAFLENPYEKPFINHINGIRSDNRLENLEWCTQYENVYHSIHCLGHSMSRPKSTAIWRKPIARYMLDLQFIDQYENIQEATKALGFKFKTIEIAIHNAKGGFTHASCGYKWKLI